MNCDSLCRFKYFLVYTLFALATVFAQFYSVFCVFLVHMILTRRFRSVASKMNTKKCVVYRRVECATFFSVRGWPLNSVVIPVVYSRRIFLQIFLQKKTCKSENIKNDISDHLDLSLDLIILDTYQYITQWIDSAVIRCHYRLPNAGFKKDFFSRWRLLKLLSLGQ